MTFRTNLAATVLATAGLCALAAASQVTTDESYDDSARIPPYKAEIVLARGGGAVRGGGATSRSAGVGRAVRSGSGSSVNHRADRGQNVNRHVNRNVNVSGAYGGYDDDWDDRPLAAAAAVTTVAAVTAAAVGSVVTTVPPNCGNVDVGGVNYYLCGNTWYQPQYSGTSVQYVVVNPPQ